MNLLLDTHVLLWWLDDPKHHHDPFDRMLIAQALHDGLQLVSRDPQIARYQVPLIVA